MTTLLQDLRYGIRLLSKNSGVAAVAVLSLALGIGVNTTIFSFVNALLLRPPSVEEPARLFEVWGQNRRSGSPESYLPLTYPDYVYYRDHNRSFTGMLAFDGDSTSVNWSRAEGAEIARAQLVSGNYFSVLGVKATLGRTFLAEEDRTPGAHPVIVLGHRFWEQKLGSNPDVVGKPLTFNGHDFIVVGVAPAGFSGMLVGLVPDFWVPMMMAQQINRRELDLTTRNSYWLFAIGRLKPDAGLSQARADLSLLGRQLAQTYPKSNKEIDAALFPATLLPGPYRGYVWAFAGLLMTVVGLVLMIACANAANLLLVLASARQREIAIRSAIGAKRGRIVRQMLTESILLACLGGGAGILLALWTGPLLLNLTPPTLPIRLEVPFDWRVLGFTFLLSLLTGAIFGLAPALHSSKFDLTPALKGESYGGYRKSRLRSLLVVGQIAVCLLLLLSAGLCIRSLLNAQAIDPGFETKSRLMATLDLKSLAYSESQGRAFYERLLERARSLPGIRLATLADYLPLTTVRRGLGVTIEGHQPPPGESAIAINSTDVGPEYFQTVGTPLLRGRDFSSRDHENAPRVVIINEAMANHFWPGQNPVGLRFGIGDVRNQQSYEIIGVVKTGKYRTLSENPHPFLYRSILQHYHAKATLVAHFDGNPALNLTAIRNIVQALDPNLALLELGTLQQHMAFALFTARVSGLLLGAFGLLGLVLAMVGLFGVIAYTVSQRTHEIGVRMALGAEQQDVLKMVVGHGTRLALLGVGIGLLAAFGVTRFLSSLLYGVSSTDPLTFFGVSVLFLAIAILASYLPARRAAKVDPMVALRYE